MRIAALCLAPLLLLAGCGDQPEDKPARDPASTAEQRQRDEALLKWYQEKAAEEKRTLAIRARTFREAISGLLQSPEPQRLATARETWRGLYEAWNLSMVPLYSLAQLDAGAARRLRRSDPLPILPGYIDGLSQWPDSGIVNDATVAITEEELVAQQGATADGEVSLGFQVIHFLLHGEPDHARTAASFTAITEAPPESEIAVEEMPDNRRRRYLDQATSILTRDLEVMAGHQTALVTPVLLVESLRRLTEKLIRLENLADATDVAGEYLPAGVREQAARSLRQSLHDWTGPDTPLMAALERHDAGVKGLQASLASLEKKSGIGSLQELHAELAAVSSRLRGRQQARN